MGKKHPTSSSDSEDESITDDSEETAQESSEEGRLEDDDQDRFSQLAESEDFRDFIRIAVATGKATQEQLENISALDKAKLVDLYEAWVQDGRKRPQMPGSVEKSVEVIEKIYRTKPKGEQFLYYVVKGQQRPVGIRFHPIYAKIDGPNGPEDDPSTQTGERKEYLIPYKESMARELLAKARRYTDDVGLYLVQNNIKIKVFVEENFFGDFDDTMRRAVQARERV